MERQFVAWLTDRIPRHPRLGLGPGDDAAILELAGSQQCVVTVDLISDGVDFHADRDQPRRIGRKALAVNLSDLAAMAATPTAALVALALPPSVDVEWLKQLYEGLLELAEKYDVAIAGGDTNVFDGPLTISITAIGTPGPNGATKRSAARPGDQIFVTGAFGGSALGHHFDFEPRVAEALWLREHYAVRAAIDVSDGLTLDVSRMAEASGCGAVIELDRVPISAAAMQLARDEPGAGTALEHALGDGEDFELIFAVSPERAVQLESERGLSTPVTRIGQFVPERGLWQQASDGARRPLAARGYEHQFGS